MEEVVERTEWHLWGEVDRMVKYLAELYLSANHNVQHEFDNWVLKGTGTQMAPVIVHSQFRFCRVRRLNICV
jgi:hypothetical protein